MLPHILSDSLSLDLLAPRHAAALFAAVEANRAHLREWLPWVDETRSVDDTRRFIDRMRDQYRATEGFQATILTDGEVVGLAGHHRIDWRNRSTSLGYWLARDRQGKGIMTRTCTAIVDHAFRTLDLHRVEIRCAAGNRRSRALAERLGFRSEGERRGAELLNGAFVDHVIYACLAPEWRAETVDRRS